MTERILIQHLLDRRAGIALDSTILSASTTTFLAPTSPLSGRMTDDGSGWTPPSPSIASRFPALKSRGSCRGSTVDHRTNRQIVYESELEAGLADMLMARPDVAQVIDQPPPVSYVGSDGVPRRHTFDFLAISTQGERIAFAVKPAAKVEKSGIEETVSLIAAQVGSRFADRYLVRTDHHITKTRTHNARLILRSRRCENHQDNAVLRDLTSSLHGNVRIADLVSESGIGPRGFNALVCLISDGALELVKEVRIDYRAVVHRAGIH